MRLLLGMMLLMLLLLLLQEGMIGICGKWFPFPLGYSSEWELLMLLLLLRRKEILIRRKT